MGKKLQTRYWSLDMTRFGVGVSVLLGLYAVKDPTASIGRLAWYVAFAIGVGLIVLSIQRSPAVVVEKPWRDRLNEFRDETAAVLPIMAHHEPSFWAQREMSGTTWREVAAKAPWPYPRLDHPLSEADAYLSSSEVAQEARDLYAFAKFLAATRLISQSHQIVVATVNADQYRRQSINMFDEFGRYLDDKVRRFDAFLERANVRGEYSDVLVLLAYWNIAVAAIQGSNAPAKQQEGFWNLGARWAEKTLSLTRPRVQS